MARTEERTPSAGLAGAGVGVARAPAPPRWRDRVLPKSILGMAILILFTSLGAAFSGAILYSFYEFRSDKTEQRVDDFVGAFGERFEQAKSAIEAEREEAKKQVRDELEPIKQLTASGDTLSKLLEKVSPSVWFVRTLDEAGQPSVGSAFVVASDAEESLLVTDFETVRAATRRPGPEIVVVKGDEQLRATLHTWQEERDLALLIIAKGGTPKLEWATGDSPVKLGERVFAVSGLGAAGGSVTQGFVADVSANGIQHDAPVGAHFRGGPLINSNGEVLAVASAAYAPLGFRPDAVYFGVPIRSTCEKILRCPDGGAGGAGAAR